MFSAGCCLKNANTYARQKWAQSWPIKGLAAPCGGVTGAVVFFGMVL